MIKTSNPETAQTISKRRTVKAQARLESGCNDMNCMHEECSVDWIVRGREHSDFWRLNPINIRRSMCVNPAKCVDGFKDCWDCQKRLGIKTKRGLCGKCYADNYTCQSCSTPVDLVGGHCSPCISAAQEQAEIEHNEQQWEERPSELGY